MPWITLIITKILLRGKVQAKFDLDCQKVLIFQKLARGKIPNNLKIGTLNVPEYVKDSVKVDSRLWILARRKTSILMNEIKGPSFIAMKSLLSLVNVKITKSAFTPIMPHPATDFSTI